MKKYRSVKSAYRDGFRIDNLKDYGDYCIISLTNPNNDGKLMLEETKNKLIKFFGIEKLSLLLHEKGC